MIRRKLRRFIPKSLWNLFGLAPSSPPREFLGNFTPLPLNRERQTIAQAHSPRRQEQSVINRSWQRKEGRLASIARTKARVLTEDSRVLVTGGAGFIGSALIHALNLKGVSDIVVVDLLGCDEKWRNLVPLTYADFVPANDFLARIMSDSRYYGDFQTVFHLGACSATTEKDADYLVRNNFEYSKSLCLWASELDARFVYASSAATYGDGSQGMSDESPIHALRPLNMYGYSKQMFDLWAKQEGFLQSIVGLKYFNVFGPNEYHKEAMRSLVCKAYEQICDTGKLKLFKSHRSDYRDGEQMRDFVYVKDAVAMTLYLAECPQAFGLYNVGSGEPRTWLDLARAIFESLNLPENIEFIDMPENIRHQYQYHTEANLNRLRKSGYQQSTTKLESAISDYIKHYLQPSQYLGNELSKEVLPYPTNKVISKELSSTNPLPQTLPA